MGSRRRKGEELEGKGEEKRESGRGRVLARVFADFLCFEILARAETHCIL